MKGAGHVAKRSGLSRSHFTGHNGNCLLINRKGHSLQKGFEAGERIQILHRNVLGEGVFLEAKMMPYGIHQRPPAVRSKSLPPVVAGTCVSAGTRLMRLFTSWFRSFRKPRLSLSTNTSIRSSSLYRRLTFMPVSPAGAS